MQIDNAIHIQEEFLDSDEQQLTKVGWRDKVNNLVKNGFRTSIRSYVRGGWEIFKANAGLFTAFTFFTVAVTPILIVIPFAALAIAPLWAGMSYVGFKTIRSEEVQFRDFFKGFHFFAELLAASIIGTAITVYGTFFLVLPGIYFAVAFGFTQLLILDKNIKWSEALKISRQLISKNWFTFLGLAFVIGFFNFLGFLTFGVGLFITIPFTTCIMVAAYEHIVGVEDYEVVQD